MNPILEGWKCPSCFLVHAPFVKSCDCMVIRARDSAGPLTTSEAVAKNEVMDAWEKSRYVEMSRPGEYMGCEAQGNGDQW